MLNDAQSVPTIETIAKAHRKGGTAYLLPTLVDEKPSAMTAALNAIEQGIEKKVDGLLGIHLEGPWLNPVRGLTMKTASGRALNSWTLFRG